jgi:serine/threonine-protein kinase
VRIVIADDSFLTRHGIAALLIDAGHDVVAEAIGAGDAIAAVERHRPDAAIIDIRMPPTHTNEGLVAAAHIREQFDGTVVLVLSNYIEPAYALGLVEAYPRGSGYLLKDRIVQGDTLLQALERLTSGECVIDQAIVARLLQNRRNRDPVQALTNREREVLALVAEGRSNGAIAVLLGIAERTVESHTAQIFMKLGIEEEPDINRRVLAVLAYLRSTA